jgi:hypothetical protein
MAATKPITAKTAIQPGSDRTSATMVAVNHRHPASGLLSIDIGSDNVRIAPRFHRGSRDCTPD